MKTKSRNLIISFLLTLAMLFGVFAISPMTASAVSSTPAPEETPAETVYVGSVALSKGQYVKNAETTAVTGEPAEDADGYAYYKADGTLLLASYSYEGDGYEYDSGMYAVIYSSGALSVELRGENVLKQTSEGKRGIFAVGNLDIDGVGSLSVSADWSIYSNGIITFKETLGKVDLTVTGTGRAVVSRYDSGSATDHDESIFVKGGDISATTYYGLDDLVITGGALTISSSYYALNMHPVINYDGEYTAVVSDNEDGSDSVAYDPAKLVTEIPNNYFRITPAPKTAIDSVSVSGIDLPEFGEAFNAEVDLDALTYGGEYKVADHWLEKYTGDEWVEYTGSDDLIEYGVRYRYVLSLMPNGGYSFSSEITDGDVKINDKAATVYKITEYPFYNAVEIACEFSYEATFITSISVSGADLPEVGETADDMEFTPTSLTYGGAYQMIGTSIEKYTGTNWVFYSSGSDDVIEAGVRYRLIITLMPTGTDAFAERLTSDDVTFNGKDAEFLGFVNAGTAKYAQIALEFSYEASATDYGIIIADKDGSGATVGVLITEENYTDVLGDGTVSFDPTTNILTLNGYKYEGEGFLIGSDSYYGICVTEFFDDLTLVLVGENVITLTEPVARMMRDPYYTGIELWSGNMTIKGDGSLAISSPKEGICVYGIEDGRGALEIKGGSLTIDANYEGIYTDNSFKMTGGSLTVGATYGIDTYVFEMNGGSITVNAVGDDAPGAICAYESFLMNGGTITVTANGEDAYAIYAEESFVMNGGTITASATGDNAYTIYLEGDFTMNGGSLKLSADCDGIGLWEDSTLVISGGTLEISTKEAGHAFIRATESDGSFSIVPTVTGDYSMTASVNEDGSGAAIYDEDAHETYKYVKIAFVTKYGITIADKDESGATVGVEITSENCTDVLGDGTVSYDPTTNTLTLNNYVYNGEGVLVDEGGYMAIMADIPAEGLTIVLVGENSITVSGSDSAGMVFFGEGDLAVKGNGSLSINSIMYGITLQSDSGKLTTENAKLNITTTGAMAIGIQATDFVMTSGDLKITASMIGIGTSKETGICINGGSVEIGTATGGYAFIYLDFEHLSFNPIKPDLSGYVGAYKMTAGVNQDGSDATDFNEGYLNSYKYVKVEPTHVHDHGTTWVTDANEHWNECACGDKANKAAHSGGTATCQAKAKCEVCNAEYGELAACAGGTATCTEKAKCATCGNEYGELAPHNYNITNGYKGADGHANTCSCGAHDTPVAHTPDRAEATETDPIKCTVCGYVIEPVKGHVHDHGTAWESDANEHWNECACGDKANKAAHTDSDTNGKCDVCGADVPVAPPSHTHDYGTIWKTDANNHWKECECGEKSENAAHIDGNGDSKCDTCDYAMPTHDPDDPGTTPPADNPPTDDDGGLGTGAIVGVVIGSTLVAGVGGFALFWFVIKKKTWADFLAIFKKK